MGWNSKGVGSNKQTSEPTKLSSKRRPNVGEREKRIDDICTIRETNKQQDR